MTLRHEAVEASIAAVILRPSKPISYRIAVNQRRDCTEEAILEVASYGKQLGRIGEALLAIVEQPNTANFTDDQKRAIEDFKTLMREIAGAKKRSVERPSS